MSEANQTPAQVTPNAGTEALQTAAPVDQTAQTAQAPDAKSEASTTTAPKEGETKPLELKAPEGSPLSPEALAKLTELAKEQGLTQEQAQKYVDHESALLTDYMKTQQDQWKAQTDKWAQEAKADKEIGGVNFQSNVEHAHRAMKAFASDSLISFLDSTGLGNNPEVIKLFHRISKLTREDSLVSPSNQALTRRPPEEVLYGNSKR